MTPSVGWNTCTASVAFTETSRREMSFSPRRELSSLVSPKLATLLGNYRIEREGDREKEREIGSGYISITAGMAFTSLMSIEFS